MKSDNEIDISNAADQIIGGLKEKVESLTKNLSIVERKFEQIEGYMKYYEKWYADIVTKATATIEELRRFMGQYTDDDLQHIERVIKAVHGE